MNLSFKPVILVSFLYITLSSCGEKDYVAPLPTVNKDTIDYGPLPDTGVWVFHSHHIGGYTADEDKQFMDKYRTYRFRFDGHNIYSENGINSIKDTGRWERKVIDNIKYYDIQFNGNDTLLTWYNDAWRIKDIYYPHKNMVAGGRLFLFGHQNDISL